MEILSGFEDTLTAQQREAFDQMKATVVASEFAVDFAAHPAGNRWLLKYLRATAKDKTGKREFMPTDAYKRLKASFLWRREHKIDALMLACERNEPPEKWELYRDCYPCIDVINPETGTIMRFQMFGMFTSGVDLRLMSDEEWLQCLSYDSLNIEKTLRRESLRLGHEKGTFQAAWYIVHLPTTIFPLI